MKTNLVLATLALILAGTLPSASSAGACSELSIRNVHGAGPVQVDHSLDQLDCDATTATGAGALILSGEVRVMWFHDVAGLTGFTLLLEGPGVFAELPLEAARLGSGSLVYKTPVHALPEGFEGELAATLLKDGEPVETVRARTPP